MDTTLYPGIAFSPQTVLADNIGAADTIIKVTDVTAFPKAPNLATIGTDGDGETIFYAAKTESTLSGCVRGVEGTPKSWSAGEPIGRNFTAKDHGDLIGAVLSAQMAAAAAQETALDKQDKLTGTPDQVVGFDASGAALAVPRWSNRNLIINWDFRNPVNRNKQTAYAGNVQTIDCWGMTQSSSNRMQILDGYIQVSLGNIGAFVQIFQKKLPAGKYTFSFLTMDRSLYSISFDWPQEGHFAQLVNINNKNILLWANPDSILFHYNKDENNGDETGIDLELKAVKLEHGNRQTLARQNEDGEWEIIDPPDYDLQYALCSQYSPSTGEWVGYQHSNKDLLDNSHFADPINQRGQTEYSGAVYGIDRWKGSASYVHIALESDGLTVGRTPGSTNASTKNAVQFIENWQQLAGRTITISAIVSRATGTALIYLFNKTMTTSYGNASGTYTGKPLLITKTVTLPENIDGLQFQLRAQSGDDGSSATFLAAKLELGPIQTLAHQDADGNWVLNDPPPNKALELAKCQRYQLVLTDKLAKSASVGSGFATLVNTIQVVVPTPVTLRAAPAISYTGNWQIVNPGLDVTSITVGSYTENSVRLVVTGNSNTLTPGNGAVLRAKADATAKIILDANL